MNQHPKAKAARITPGTCTIAKHSTHNKSYLFSDVIGTTAAYISNDDAPVMADALNTMNTHGHTPSEMVAIIRDLRKHLDDVLCDCASYAEIYTALTKTQDFR